MMNLQVPGTETCHYEWQELDLPARACVRMIRMLLRQPLATNDKLGER